jgi:hypothetical protein
MEKKIKIGHLIGIAIVLGSIVTALVMSVFLHLAVLEAKKLTADNAVKQGMIDVLMSRGQISDAVGRGCVSNDTINYSRRQLESADPAAPWIVLYEPSTESQSIDISLMHGLLTVPLQFGPSQTQLEPRWILVDGKFASVPLNGHPHLASVGYFNPRTGKMAGPFVALGPQELAGELKSEGLTDLAAALYSSGSNAP